MSRAEDLTHRLAEARIKFNDVGKTDFFNVGSTLLAQYKKRADGFEIIFTPLRPKDAKSGWGETVGKKLKDLFYEGSKDYAKDGLVGVGKDDVRISWMNVKKPRTDPGIKDITKDLSINWG